MLLLSSDALLELPSSSLLKLHQPPVGSQKVFAWGVIPRNTKRWLTGVWLSHRLCASRKIKNITTSLRSGNPVLRMGGVKACRWACALLFMRSCDKWVKPFVPQFTHPVMIPAAVAAIKSVELWNLIKQSVCFIYWANKAAGSQRGCSHCREQGGTSI